MQLPNKQRRRRKHRLPTRGKAKKTDHHHRLTLDLTGNFTFVQSFLLLFQGVKKKKREKKKGKKEKTTSLAGERMKDLSWNSRGSHIDNFTLPLLSSWFHQRQWLPLWPGNFFHSKDLSICHSLVTLVWSTMCHKCVGGWLTFLCPCVWPVSKLAKDTHSLQLLLLLLDVVKEEEEDNNSNCSNYYY